MKIRILIFVLIIFTSFSSQIYAHDDERIHPLITENSAKNSQVHNYLKNNLNFKDGLETKLPNNGENTILKWLTDGSTAEDSPMCRASNHFHDPMNTKLWNTAGMSDSPWWINIYCHDYTPFYSTVTWATGFTAPTSTPIPYNPGNEKSPNMWANARSLYLSALTATTQTTREDNFAQMFTALGQVLHLLQDMSVPAHVRNDFQSHLIFNGFCTNDECSGNPIDWFGNPFERYIKANSQLVSAAESTPPTFTNPRLTDFWDTNQYTGTNPSNSTTLGLAEITNTNYLSDSTILNNNPSTEHVYPFPKVNSQDYSICIDNEMETTDPRKYVCRNDSSNPSGAISLLNEESSITNDNIATFKLVLDDNVHDAYARELLPLAIGYSSELLKYFFRGQMEVKCLPVIKENKISYVKLSIKNATLNEAMTNGKLMLTGKYIDNNNEEIIFRAKYGASDYAVIGSLDYGQVSEGLNFLFPEGTQIPVDQWDSIKLTLTYQGKLGSEEGAVIGKVFSPGKLKFNEELNTAPKGDYNWFQMDSPVFGTNICPYHNIEHGVAQNEIVGGKLIKTNIRYPIADPSGLYPGAHFNLSLVGIHNLSGNTYANNIFPIPITKDTYIEFKIDDMTISPITAASGIYTHYQGMVLSFNNGYKLELSLNDQFWYINSTTGYFTFSAGYIILDNIHNMFAQYNLPVPADFKLNSIGLHQQIGFDLPLDTQYEQQMTVDFIRIVEMLNTGI